MIIGDRVTVYRKSKAGYWSPVMDTFVGKSGIIVSKEFEESPLVKLDGVSFTYYIPTTSLKLEA